MSKDIKKQIKLFLFTTDLDFALSHQKAGIDSVIVDWETKGKDQRQAGFNLEINKDTPEDVNKLSQALDIPVTVRVNQVSDETKAEVDLALKNGAQIIMLPVAKSAAEVAKFIKIVNNRAKTLVQIETQELVKDLPAFSKLNWDYAYIGLNDLMVSRGGKFIWQAVVDGTVEKICHQLKGRNYGFGGITVVGGGIPIDFELLLHEYTRLNCNLCFLRRTYKRELLDRNIQQEIKAIRVLTSASFNRGQKSIEYDHKRLIKLIKTVYQDLL